MVSSMFPLPPTFSALTQLVVRGRHSPLDGDGHGAQRTALGHDDVEQATPETGYRPFGPVHTALVSHYRGSRQLAGLGQVIGVAANLYLEGRFRHVLEELGPCGVHVGLSMVLYGKTHSAY